MERDKDKKLFYGTYKVVQTIQATDFSRNRSSAQIIAAYFIRKQTYTINKCNLFDQKN